MDDLSHLSDTADDPLDAPKGERGLWIKAVKDNWPVPAKVKSDLLKKLVSIAKSRRAGSREKIRAVEAIIAAGRFDHEVADENAKVDCLTVEINVLRGGCTADELDALAKPVAASIQTDQL